MVLQHLVEGAAGGGGRRGGVGRRHEKRVSNAVNLPLLVVVEGGGALQYAGFSIHTPTVETLNPKP